MTKIDALKPCPFCGFPAEKEPWHGGSPTKQAIKCSSDECDVCPMVTGETSEEAVDRWNRRARLSEAEPAQTVRVKPLEWEEIGVGFYRAKAPLFGNLRVERYGNRFTTCYSIPGYSDVFADGDYANAALAMLAVEKKYQTLMTAALTEAAEPQKPQPDVTSRWRIFEDATSHGYWGIELEGADNHDDAILYPQKIHRDTVARIVDTHNASSTPPTSDVDALRAENEQYKALLDKIREEMGDAYDRGLCRLPTVSKWCSDIDALLSKEASK